MNNVKELIYRCKSLTMSSEEFEYLKLDEDIVKYLGWEDRYSLLSDNNTGYPIFSFSGNDKPYPPRFTKSIYEVIPYLSKELGWEIKVPCPNESLQTLTGRLPCVVRMFNLDKKIDVLTTCDTVELAFCASWLTVISKGQNDE